MYPDIHTVKNLNQPVPPASFFDDNKLSDHLSWLADPREKQVSDSVENVRKNRVDPHYLESLAESRKTSIKTGYTCTPNFIVSRCKNNHLTLMRVACGLETCNVCGKKDSDLHRRRQAKLWTRFVDMAEKLGYVVLTYPPECHEIWYNIQFLKESRIYFQEYMKREFGYTLGFFQFHMQGDKSPKYFPHWNWLILNGDWIDKAKIAKAREDFQRWLKNKWGIDAAAVDWHTEFATTLEHRIHLVEYICRPTYHDYSTKKERVYRTLRRSGWFGKWPESLEDIRQRKLQTPESVTMSNDEIYRHRLAHHRCPVCNESTVSTFQHHNKINIDDYVEMVQGEIWVKYDSS